MTLSQVGELASSKSAMNTLAPELRALIIILRSTGPVISTRRSTRALGASGTVQSPVRTSAVSARKSGRSPASKRAWRSARAASSSSRRALEPPVQPDHEVDGLRGQDPVGVGVGREADVVGHMRRLCKRNRRLVNQISP